MRERRQFCTHLELKAALAALDGRPRTIPASEWPGVIQGLDQSGLYSWWVDQSGAADLTKGLGLPVAAARIYAGQTGATAWPSGTVRMTTLRGRIGGNHLRGRVRGSTFRLTLAAALRRPLGLNATGPRLIDPESEHALSSWMAQHLTVAVHPFAERDTLADLEDRVLAVLDPPFNIEGMPASPVRLQLSKLRKAIGDAPVGLRPAGTSIRIAGPTAPTVTQNRATEQGRVTLHEEIADILRANGNQWMTTTEIADEVNRRDIYHKRDGSPVDDFQVHGRTKNYPHLFERDGSRVRLVG